MLQSELLGIDTSQSSSPLVSPRSSKQSTPHTSSAHSSPRRVLHFSPRTPDKHKSFFGSQTSSFVSSPLATPKIPKAPFKMLDAPGLKDDFYINVLDWSKKNILCVGLDTMTYLWNAVNNNVFL